MTFAVSAHGDWPALDRVGLTAKKLMTQEEWAAWVESLAGSITDPTFERPPQGEFEVREEMP